MAGSLNIRPRPENLFGWFVAKRVCATHFFVDPEVGGPVAFGTTVHNLAQQSPAKIRQWI